MLRRRLENLFAAMSRGGQFGVETILWFDGGLFADTDVIPLTAEEINNLAIINTYDWASVEPSIFGTLFQRTLDPSTRATSRPVHQPPGHRNPLGSGPALPVAAGMGGGQAAVRGRALARKIVETSRPRAARQRARTRPAQGVRPRDPQFLHKKTACPATFPFSTRPVAKAISSTYSPSTCSWIWRRKSSVLRRHAGPCKIVPSCQPGAASPAGDQPLRPSSLPGRNLDRLFPMDAPQRVRDHLTDPVLSPIGYVSRWTQFFKTQARFRSAPVGCDRLNNDGSRARAMGRGPILTSTLLPTVPGN